MAKHKDEMPNADLRQAVTTSPCASYRNHLNMQKAILNMLR